MHRDVVVVVVDNDDDDKSQESSKDKVFACQGGIASDGEREREIPGRFVSGRSKWAVAAAIRKCNLQADGRKEVEAELVVANTTCLGKGPPSPV